LLIKGEKQLWQHTYISLKGIKQQNNVLPRTALYNETKIISDKF